MNRSVLLVALGLVICNIVFVASHSRVGLPNHVRPMTLTAEESSSTTPNYVHLSLTGNPTEMVVSWHTMAKTYYSGVKYGTTSGSYASSVLVPSRNRTYHESAGYVHSVVVTGLKPGSIYYYVCGSPVGGFSQEFSFTAARTVGAPSSPVSVAMFGDASFPYDKATVARIMSRSKDLDFVYHVGDISYANTYPDSQYEQVWNEWFQGVEPLSAKKPYMTVPGNHEYSCQEDGSGDCANYAEDFKVYNYRFRMPGNESGSNTNMFYSFDYANIHFVAISTETSYPHCPFPSEFGDQLSWLQRDLAKANQRRSITPWIVVIGHRPMYCTKLKYENDGDPQKSAKHVQHAFEYILNQNNVDLYITGHVHDYERTFPVYADQVASNSYENPSATVHIVTGAAGCVSGLTKDSHLDPNLPPWVAKRYHKGEGYGVLTVVDNRSLQWAFYKTIDDSLEDSFTITKW